MSIATRRAWLRSGGAATLYSLAALILAPLRARSGRAVAGTVEQQAGRLGARLSLNENALGCSPTVQEAIRNSLADLNRYTERDAELLTAQIAAKEAVKPEQVILGEVLSVLGTQLAVAGGPGGEFIYSIPGFTELVSGAARAGGVAIGIPLNARLENDLAAIAARVSARTRAVYLVNPHNPSGTVSDADTLRAFARDLSQKAPVVVDEAYLEYTDSFANRTLAPLVAGGHNVVVFRTFDKAYGLAGLQFGYALAPVSLADALRQEGVGAAHGLNRLAVVGAAAALRDVQFVEATRRKTATERDRWNRALSELGLHHSQSQASFVFFETKAAYQDVAAAFLANGVQIGRSFPPLDRWIRISIGSPEDNTLAIETLRRIVAQVGCLPAACRSNSPRQARSDATLTMSRHLDRPGGSG